MQKVVRGLRGPHAHGVYVVTGTTLIGRAAATDIQILDQRVSRQHARLVLGQDGSMTLLDLQSNNGTFVGGYQIHSRVLKSGDRFQIGVAEYVFEEIARDDLRTSPNFRSKLTTRATLGATIVRKAASEILSSPTAEMPEAELDRMREAAQAEVPQPDVEPQRRPTPLPGTPKQPTPAPGRQQRYPTGTLPRNPTPPPGTPQALPQHPTPSPGPQPHPSITHGRNPTPAPTPSVRDPGPPPASQRHPSGTIGRHPTPTPAQRHPTPAPQQRHPSGERERQTAEIPMPPDDFGVSAAKVDRAERSRSAAAIPFAPRDPSLLAGGDAADYATEPLDPRRHASAPSVDPPKRRTLQDMSAVEPDAAPPPSEPAVPPSTDEFEVAYPDDPAETAQQAVDAVLRLLALRAREASGAQLRVHEREGLRKLEAALRTRRGSGNRRRWARLPCKLSARVGDTSFQATVTDIGAGGISIEGSELPIAPGDAIIVRVQLGEDPVARVAVFQTVVVWVDALEGTFGAVFAGPASWEMTA